MLKTTDLKQSAHHELPFTASIDTFSSGVEMIAVFEYNSTWTGGPVLNFMLAESRVADPKLNRTLCENFSFQLSGLMLPRNRDGKFPTGKDLDNPTYLTVDEHSMERVMEWATALVTPLMGKFIVKFEKDDLSLPF